MPIVELAMSLTPEQAVNVALDKRFLSKGKLDSKGNVLNYEERFQYGEDMLDSGKWGRDGDFIFFINGDNVSSTRYLTIKSGV